MSSSIAHASLDVAFRSAEEAWLWTYAALMARRSGARRDADGDRMHRPCEPDDVIRCLDQLYRRRRIAIEHARVLRFWGERGMAPQAAHGDARLWREAMARLDAPLRAKGIVGV